jgi:hypothetical protein
MITKPHIEPADIMILTVKIMEVVEKTRDSGPEKKQLVLEVLRLIVDRRAEDSRKEEFMNIVNVLVPPSIDAIVSSYNRDYKLGRKWCCF